MTITGFTGDPVFRRSDDEPLGFQIDTGFSELISDLRGRARDPITGGSNNDTTIISWGGSPEASNNMGDTPNMSVENPQVLARRPGTQGGGGGQNPPRNTDTGGGGGGGDTELEQLAKMDRNPVQEDRYQQLLEAARSASRDETGLIDEAFNASMTHLDAFENSLRRNFPSILEEARQMYEAQVAQAEAGRRQGVEQVEESEMQARQSARDLANRQARTFSEMLTGAQQRFGTDSNVGQASQAILGREFQRESAMTQRQLMNTQRQLEQEQRRINENFQVQKQQLMANRDRAINSAHREFDQKLLEISENRAMLEGQKSNAKLGALQNLHNRIMQINMQQVQFEQALEQQEREAMMNLELFQRQLAASNQAQSGALESALGVFGQDVNAPEMNFVAGSSENDPRYANYRGRVSGTDDDFLQGIIQRAGQLVPGRDEQNQ